MTANSAVDRLVKPVDHAVEMGSSIVGERFALIAAAHVAQPPHRAAPNGPNWVQKPQARAVKLRAFRIG